MKFLGRSGKRSRANQNEAGHRHGGESYGDILFLERFVQGIGRDVTVTTWAPKIRKILKQKRKPYYLWVLMGYNCYSPLIMWHLIMHVALFVPASSIRDLDGSPRMEVTIHNPWIFGHGKNPPNVWVTKSEEPGGQTVDFGGFPM